MKFLDKIAMLVLGLTAGAILLAVCFLAWHEFGILGIVGLGWVLALSWALSHFGFGVMPVPFVPKPDSATMKGK